MKIKLFLCGGETPTNEYPLGLGYLKSNTTNADIEIVKDRSLLENCDLIGLSTNAWGVKEALEILYNTDIPVVIGGQGTLWEELIKYDFKHIVIGEGETALNEIINGCDDKVINCKNIEDIDTIKFPDRGRCGKEIPIFTSRGCPFNCSFCSSRVFWQDTRFHSAEYFIDEVYYLIDTYPQIKLLNIMDDLFIANKTRFDKIYSMWMARGFNKRLKIHSFVRAGLFTKEMGLKMKEMGFKWIRFGAESGSDRILSLLDKGNTVENNQRIIDIANDIGLPICASFMYDIPTETQEEKRMTLDFIRKNKGKLGSGGWYKFRAFPGTDFYAGEDLLTESMAVR